MPCDCSHLEPTYNEIESKKICTLICVLLDKIEGKPPEWIKKCSEDYYGCRRKLAEAERILYSLIKSLDNESLDIVIYNAKSKDSRRLADWYEDYDKKIHDAIAREQMAVEEERKAKNILERMRDEEVEIIKNYLTKGAGI